MPTISRNCWPAGPTPPPRFAPGRGVDEPIAWYDYSSGSQVIRWLHADRQGSIVAQSLAAGTVPSGGIYAYGPYGEPQAWILGGSRFAYTGQVQLPEIGLYHYKARAYDPASGRFMQTDPAGYTADVNLYTYAAEDPIGGSDPSGMTFSNCWTGSRLGPDAYCTNNDIAEDSVLNNSPGGASAGANEAQPSE